ncbi:hypothetical protein PHLGIDRAFT_119767 [Phlebiopsis gigantea 11061_1 CR5-6]|uniref:Uncharacterized protein n=1 Tax=Phlebiopsis gigantea (strain 11061_1 CR5-6) TaxID=745531 RepID=A0A0C3PHY3_PHLG1|nr:hypothetical protein PHLGIDRAFT_119767 [Phlebiopsis gigantea 11061_1 CR5-6]
MTQKHGAKINDILPILGRCNPCGRIMISSFAQTHLCPPESPPSSPTFLSKGKKLGLYSPGARHIDLPSTSQMRLTPLSPSLHAASQSSQTTSSQVTYPSAGSSQTRQADGSQSSDMIDLTLDSDDFTFDPDVSFAPSGSQIIDLTSDDDAEGAESVVVKCES